MKSLRTAITANQLPSVLTHCTLIIIIVKLHTQRYGHIRHKSRNTNVQRQVTVSEWILYHACGCLPPVVKGIPSSFGLGCSIYLLWLTTRVKFPVYFSALSGCSCWMTNIFDLLVTFNIDHKKQNTSTHPMSYHLSQAPVWYGSSLCLHGWLVAQSRRHRRRKTEWLVSGLRRTPSEHLWQSKG